MPEAENVRELFVVYGTLFSFKSKAENVSYGNLLILLTSWLLVQTGFRWLRVAFI